MLFLCIIKQRVWGHASRGKYELSVHQKYWFLAFNQVVCVISDAFTAKLERISFRDPPPFYTQYFLSVPTLSNLTSLPYLLKNERSLRSLIIKIIINNKTTDGLLNEQIYQCLLTHTFVNLTQSPWEKDLEDPTPTLGNCLLFDPLPPQNF